MAYRLRVCCVLRKDSGDVPDAIGGLTEDGSRWWLTMQQAIEGAERNRWAFYLSNGYGSATDLTVEVRPDGTKVLIPVNPSNHHPGSLAELPECRSMKEAMEQAGQRVS